MATNNQVQAASRSCNGVTRCRSIGAFILVLVLGGALAACANVSNLTGPSQDFVNAANALAQAESDYFDEIQAASDASYRLQAAETYVAHNSTFAGFAKELAKHDDFSKAKALRMAAMQQLQNYAQQIEAITAGANASWISDDAKSATTNVNALVKDAGQNAAAQFFTSHSGAIQTAVTDLGQAIVSYKSAEELQALATEAQKPIAQIAEMVKQDNANIESDNFTASLASDQTQAVKDILHSIYDDPKVSAFDRLSALQLASNWKPSLVTKGQAIQSALAKLQAANDAMAKKQPTSVSALAQEAYSFAEQAIATRAPTAASSAK